MGTMFTNTPTSRFESASLFWKRVAGGTLLFSATLLCIGCMQPSEPSRRKLPGVMHKDESSEIHNFMQKMQCDTIEDLTDQIRNPDPNAPNPYDPARRRNSDPNAITHTIKSVCLGEAEATIDDIYSRIYSRIESERISEEDGLATIQVY